MSNCQGKLSRASRPIVLHNALKGLPVGDGALKLHCDTKKLSQMGLERWPRVVWTADIFTPSAGEDAEEERRKLRVKRCGTPANRHPRPQVGRGADG